MKINIVEIFKTIQGEGLLQGLPSVFIRIHGCNLSCNWCDTIYHPQYKRYIPMDIDEIVKKVRAYKCNQVVITGGEPLYNNSITYLIDFLKKEKYHITVETNATIIKDINCDLISMSPKLLNSNPKNLGTTELIKYNAKRRNIEAIKYYIMNHDYQIKFVVQSEEDILEIKSILDELSIVHPFKVLIMPAASSRKELIGRQKKIIKLCLENNFRYANRLQLQVWGTKEEKQ
jgi:7-carboxy-7-deazaguanine synthase